MDNSWKEEARGLPVWAGALVYDEDSAAVVVDEVADNGDALIDGCTCSIALARCVLALDNPDTCAAFVRRLAVRLGCPEEIAEIGTMFYKTRREPGTWVLAAGGRRGGAWEWWCELVSGASGTDNRLLALVRAWRSVADG